MIYSKEIEGYFFNTLHAGDIDISSAFSTSYKEGSQRQGLIIVLNVNWNALGLIVKARFKAYANPYYLAALEWLCRHFEDTYIKAPCFFEPESVLKALNLDEDHYLLANKMVEIYKNMVKLIQDKLNE